MTAVDKRIFTGIGRVLWCDPLCTWHESGRRKIGPVVKCIKLRKLPAEMPVFYVETDRKQWLNLRHIVIQMPDKILDVLKEYGLTTTFFLSALGKILRGNSKRIVDEGHEIASHGQEHIDLSPESRETIYDNIKTLITS